MKLNIKKIKETKKNIIKLKLFQIKKCLKLHIKIKNIKK